MQEEHYYRDGQAAEILGITTSQLRQYTRDGLVNAEYVSVGAGIQRARRYKGAELEDFASSHPELVGRLESEEISSPDTPFPSWTPPDSDTNASSINEEYSEPVSTSPPDDRQSSLQTDNISEDDHENGNSSNEDQAVGVTEEITESNPISGQETVEDEITQVTDEIETETVTEPFSSEVTLNETSYSTETEPSTGSGIGVSHFVFGLGATGVQIVDQARRSDFYAKENNKHSLETNYRFFVMDTSLDIDPERVNGKTHTEEGLGKWFEHDDILKMANLTGGAGRVPVVSEFIAEHALDRTIRRVRETEARLNGINTSYLIHSIGGGTGCGLAPRLGKWLSNQGRGGSRISLTLLGKSDGAVMNNVEAGNTLYAFPRLNQHMDLAILIDNETVFNRFVSDQRTGIETERYLQEIESLLSGLPKYMERPERLYAAADRYTYRIMSALNRLPEDITNILTFYKGNTRFAAGGKWAIPYLYPLNADYEYDYRDIPPALMVLRALQKGGLCSPAQIRSDSLLVIICEYPEDYPTNYVMRLVQDSQNVASDLLSIPNENIRVIPFRSTGNGFSVTALMVGSEPKIFEQWIKDASNQTKRNEIKTMWRNRVSSGGDTSGSNDAWDTICQLTAEALVDNRGEQIELADRLRSEAIQWREDASMVDICETFVEFATSTGFITEDGDIA